MLVLALLTGLAAAAPAPAGCAVGLRAEIDLSSFDAGDNDPQANTRRLASLRDSAETAFQKAADRLCRTGRLDRQAIGRFKRLIVQSGSGATETAVYEDPDRPDAIIFQWVFVEEKLALPDSADIETGILCWADPETDVCAERMP